MHRHEQFSPVDREGEQCKGLVRVGEPAQHVALRDAAHHHRGVGIIVAAAHGDLVTVRRQEHRQRIVEFLLLAQQLERDFLGGRRRRLGRVLLLRPGFDLRLRLFVLRVRKDRFSLVWVARDDALQGGLVLLPGDAAVLVDGVRAATVHEQDDEEDKNHECGAAGGQADDEPLIDAGRGNILQGRRARARACVHHDVVGVQVLEAGLPQRRGVRRHQHSRIAARGGRLVGRFAGQALVVRPPLGRIEEHLPRLGHFVQDASALGGVRAHLVGAQVRRLADRGLFDNLAVLLCGRNPQQLVMRGRPLILRDAQPLVIRIKHRVPRCCSSGAAASPGFARKGVV